MSVHNLIRDRLLQRAGLKDQPKPQFTLADLEASEWCPQFERLMRNRLIMGALRYGKINAPGKIPYARVPSMYRRLAAYGRTGNLEMLVDVANLCLLEFVEGRHPLRHFRAVDDSQEHVQKAR
ncbi:MAG: hypothetical protein U1G08_17975 [Verrucomicrobiota bacterium]